MLPSYPASKQRLIPRLICIAFLPTLLASGSDVPMAPVPTFEASAQLVLVPVTATDRRGATVDGLKAKDFTVFDNETPQRIASFAMEDGPCSVEMVLDVSGSMRNALPTARKVAHAFFQTANPDDEFGLLTISTAPKSLSSFTPDVSALERSIDSTQSGGMTALLDSVFLAVRKIKQADRPRRALLILSDGMDNYSRHTKHELMQAVLEANVQVYVILMDGLADNPSGGIFRPGMAAKPGDMVEARQTPETFNELAEITGGLHFRARNVAEATDAAMKAGIAIRNQYVIGFLASDFGTAGKWHHVRVKSNLRNINISSRSGYYSR